MTEPLDVDEVFGGAGYNPSLHTPRRDAFSSIVQDKTTFLTTREFARVIGVGDKQVSRWCHRWYGQLPPLRQGRGLGYRIHPFMLGVARGWLQTQDQVVREAIREALEKEAGDEARDWVVVVGNNGTAYYTASEALQAVNKILPGVAAAKGSRNQVAILYVGNPEDGRED